MTGEDTRTCDVCGAPVADVLKGYANSLRICNEHREAWQALPERRAAVLEMVRARTGNSMCDAFAAWVARVRGA